MTIIEVLEQARELLRSKGRITYRMLRLQFNLDDEALAVLKDELIQAERVAVDEDGKVLVWIGTDAEGKKGKWANGEKEGVSSQLSVLSPQHPTPSPRHLSSGPQTPNPELRTSQSPAPSTQPPISYTPPHLAERIRAASLSEGERKTITTLFADLKGSTALIEGLDPEEARAIIDPALQLMMDAVHRYEGYVAQALGDGIFALFGAPIAHEDHPQRALYAALRMQDEMRRYADTLRAKGYPPLLMRVGINTGEVVLRSIRKDDLHADYVPVGHSTNLAARMEQLAAPGSILVTAHTHKLTDGHFAFKDLGKTQIKGVEESLNVYEVVGAGPLRTRLQVSARRGLTSFVGRHNEMDQLQRALEQAKAGHGQIVGVMGEPGLGKSRLFYEFKLTSQAGCLVLEAYSVSHGRASPYLPVIELLKTYFQIQPQDDERTRKERITGKVLTLDRNLEDALPYLFSLLGVDDPQASLQQMDPQIRRRRIFEALKKLFLRESLNQPLILIFEDLHWIDSETQGFLDILAESVASAHLLLLVNYRPEYRHEWGAKTYYTQLRLAPFGKEEAEEFLNVLLGIPAGTVREPSLQQLKQMILDKTEGTPFFMEEIVQELVEQGVLVRTDVEAKLALPSEGEASFASTPIHIPPTVQGVLAARIDRLTPDEKALLQQLAVIGREFPLSLMRHVVPQPEEDVYRLLSSLQRKEFLYEQPAFPEVEYIFKHALTQEVAYNSVLIERRKALHDQTAQAIENLYNANLDEHYSELAHHYSRSGNTEKAVEYLGLAGQQAVQRSANAEALRHLTTALELLQTLPDTSERVRQELALQIALGISLGAVKGYAAPEVEKVYARALELCRHVGETPQLFPVLYGLWAFNLVRAEYQTARELGEQFLSLARKVQDPTLLLQAHRQLGDTLFWLGDVAAAREHLEQGIALHNPQQHRFLAFLYGEHPGVVCLGFAAYALWYLGYPDRALKKTREALTLARDLSHPRSLVFALSFAAVFHQLRREEQQTQKQAEALIALSTEHGFPEMLAFGTIHWGWALAEQRQEQEGIKHIQQSIAAWHAIGVKAGRSFFLASLAEAYGKTGQVEEGLTALAEALTQVDKTGERFYEAELYRLKGTLTLQEATLRQVSDKSQTGQEQSQTSPQQVTDKSEVPDPRPLNPDPQGEAEAYFLKAIDIARKQQAKSLELRATMSLACLWQSQGKKTEAHQMLSEIYLCFTEGFDTKDLQEAKALLDELT